MNGILERTLGILEYLAANAEGVPMASIADHLGDSAQRRASACSPTYPVAATSGRPGRHGDYVLTTKLVSLGLSYLSSSGIVDIAQPLLDRLAETSGELVRLSVVDGERLTWVARAQGAVRGLRYDPDMGSDAKLSCTATGHAWLLTMSDEDALQMVARQGFGAPTVSGPTRRLPCGHCSSSCTLRVRAAQHDRRSVHAGHDGHGRPGDAGQERDRRHQHCRPQSAIERGEDAPARTGAPRCGRGTCRLEQRLGPFQGPATGSRANRRLMVKISSLPAQAGRAPPAMSSSFGTDSIRIAVTPGASSARKFAYRSWA